MGLVLGTENSATNDTTNTTSADEGSGAKSALPLATDVVRLPCKNGGDVGVGCGGREEDTGVANTDVVGETNHGEPDESHDTVGDDPNTAHVTTRELAVCLKGVCDVLGLTTCHRAKRSQA